jgi:hypothetical protein
MGFKRHTPSDYLFLALYSFFTLILFFLSLFYFLSFYFFHFLYVQNNKPMDRLVNSATPHVEFHYSQIYQNSILDLG